MQKPVESVTYTNDDGNECFAFLLSKNPNGSVNIAWLDPDTYALHAANEVPADRIKG